MKLYKLIPTNVHKSYNIEGCTLEFNEEFRKTYPLADNWTIKKLKRAGGGMEASIIFCFYPKAIIIAEDRLPVFESEFKNEKIEFLPVTDGKKNYYILHCYECADVKNEVERQLLKTFYYVDENYGEGLHVFKLLRRGVVNVISAELYTEKMVSFINRLDDVGIDFEEVGEFRAFPE